jgi:N-acetylglucosaminyl-diphospho-decaprenol L-rhamnosyltransferase
VPVDIAFITVNYNTLECVKQLALFFGALEVPFTFSFTVVDNGSTDGSQEFLRSRTQVQSIQSEVNLGYGRAINRGVTSTDSEYVCVMNSDAILNRDALFRLWRFLEEHPKVGVCAPRITYQDGREQGMVFTRSLFSQYAVWYAKALARYAKLRIEKAKEPVRVDGVMGAFFLIRRSAIPSSSLFDEEFFFFHEDTALAHTLLNRGTPCYVVPEAKIIHVGGMSRSPASVSLFYESKYLYLRKFYGGFHAWAVYGVDRARILRKWTLYSLYSMFSSSGQIQSKQRYYKMAWDSAKVKPQS